MVNDMVEIKPFNGIRYDEKDISDLICPPYDIISSEEKEKLKKASLYNIVRVELPDPLNEKDKYQQAKDFFQNWINKKILKQDMKEAFYLYEQEFLEFNIKKVRRGFFAALKLEDSKDRSVKPHEKTLPKPKSDRLNLLRSVHANISPIFGIFSDEQKKIINFCIEFSKSDPISFAEDSDGVVHRIWRIDNTDDVNWIKNYLADRNIFIADGHHRYETAWNYFQEKKKDNKKRTRGNEYEYVLIYLSPMEDPGISIWPTHRVIDIPEDFESKVDKYFQILPEADFNKLSEKLPQPLLIYYNGKKRTLLINDKKVLDKIMPDKCKAYRELGVSILHSLLIAEISPEKITYVKGIEEAYRLADETKRAAIIVPATPISALKDIATNGQTMPQKSTYFYPKVATGMVIHSLEI